MSFQVSDLRQYLIDRIAEIDSDLSQWDLDPLGVDSIDDRIAEQYYKILIGNASFERLNTSYVENISVIIELYSPRNRDELTSFDNIYQKAFDIKDNVICPLKAKSSLAFNEIFEQGLEVEPIGEDDKSIKVSLQFTVLRYKGY